MNTQRQWIGISDLMSVLMMIFLFISIVFMLKIKSDEQQIKNQHQAMIAVASTYEQTQKELQNNLQITFNDDLKQWNAAILSNGTVRFNNPNTLFSVGSSELSGEFKKMLRNFFPRYVSILAQSEWQADIEEIRIEGHTSSDWGGHVSHEDNKYLYNSQLSQQRAFAVLEYVYTLPAVKPHRQWLQKVLRATGASYSKPIYHDTGEENNLQSRRVEFKTITRSEEKMGEILHNARNNINPTF